MDNDKMTRYKIRTIIGFSIVLMLLDGCGYKQTRDKQVIYNEKPLNINNDAEDNNVDDNQEEKIDIIEGSWEDGYKIVLNTYREETEKINENGIYWKSYSEMPELQNVDGTKIETEFCTQEGAFSFILKDIDSNEIPELFICRYLKETDSGVIYHIFTWYEGKTIELLGNLGYRSGICTICQDDLLRVEIFGSANEYCNILYYLPKNGTELEILEQFFSMQNTDDATKSDFFWVSSDDKEISITEEQYIEYEKKYVKQELKYIDGTPENIANIVDLWEE